MTHPQQIQISGPVAIQHEPQHVQVILAALSEMPFKVAQPVIRSIEAQLVEIAQRQADQAGGQAVPVPQASPQGS